MRTVQAITSDEYNEPVTHLRKNQDWEALVRYCRGVDRQVYSAIRDGTATDDDKRLRIQDLTDLQTAYMILERPHEQLRAAQQAHRAGQQVLPALGVLDDYYSYTFLARAHAANSQAEQARDMFLRAGASVITRHQAEWLGNALLDLAAFERDEGDAQSAAVLTRVAEGIKRASKKVRGGVQKSPQLDRTADTLQSDLHIPTED